MDGKDNIMTTHNIPISIKQSLDSYVEHRIPTGDFLNAVLSNDLFEAIGRADDINIIFLHNICGYIYNELPTLCHGSPKRVRKWLQRKERE